ncbi:MAG: sporulation protein YabP [Christensenellales bacterium]
MPREFENELIKSRPHRLVIDDRERATVTGITEVISFDEAEIVAQIDTGTMIISGEFLHILKLNLEEGQLIVSGYIYSIDYAESETKKSGFLSGFFK